MYSIKAGQLLRAQQVILLRVPGPWELPEDPELIWDCYYLIPPSSSLMLHGVAEDKKKQQSDPGRSKVIRDISDEILESETFFFVFSVSETGILKTQISAFTNIYIYISTSSEVKQPRV